MQGVVRIGISGWRYGPWRGVFYPKSVKADQELHFASRKFPSIELNGSFYSLQPPDRWIKWFNQTPSHFLFSVKAPRYITHIRRLKDVHSALANFFASGLLHLNEKLGPILWQLPPNFMFRDELLIDFFARLPKNFSVAHKLARDSDRFKADPAWKRTDLPIRHALEIRHHSFENPDFIDLLRQYNIALVFSDTGGKWPYMEDITSDFIYIRLHGEKQLYVSGYTDAALSVWAERIQTWRRGTQMADSLTISDTPPSIQRRDVFAYFDNDVKVRAPRDARRLNEKIKS